MVRFIIGIAILLSALALIGAAIWEQPDDNFTVAAPAAATRPAPAQTSSPAPATVSPAAPSASLAQQVDALIATRDPQKAYDAYRLLADCVSFNRDGDRLIFEAEEGLHHKNDGALPGFRTMTEPEKRRDAVLCAGMTERMRQSRIDYLAFAAQGGIPVAAIQQASEGPFGDRSALRTRPDDPLVREWKTRVQDQLARIADEQADVGVLSYLSAMRSVGDDVFDKDPALAFRYGVAMALIMQELVGPDNETAKLYRADGSLMQNAASSLTMQERAAQLAEAQRIAATARARRQRENNP
jgi:hypothetical protein